MRGCWGSFLVVVSLPVQEFVMLLSPLLVEGLSVFCRFAEGKAGLNKGRFVPAKALEL